MDSGVKNCVVYNIMVNTFPVWQVHAFTLDSMEYMFDGGYNASVMKGSFHWT